MTQNTLTVALSADFDAYIGLEDAGFNSPMDVSRGKYGIFKGVSRVIKSLEGLNLPMTFFIPGYLVDNYTETCKKIQDAGIEIALHGYTHKSPSELDQEREKIELEKGIESMEKKLGITPKGYRAPWLKPSKYTGELLSEYDFDYDASDCGEEEPFILNFPKKAIVEIPGKFELIDTPLFLNLSADSFPPIPVTVETVETIWKDEFLAMYESDEELCYVHTIHPFCIGIPSRIKMYQNLLESMKSKSGVRFVTMAELAQETLAKSQ